MYPKRTPQPPPIGERHGVSRRLINRLAGVTEVHDGKVSPFELGQSCGVEKRAEESSEIGAKQSPSPAARAEGETSKAERIEGIKPARLL
jgi:hypothetical protein